MMEAPIAAGDVRCLGEKGPRIRVIHRKNGGLSAARNTGIRGGKRHISDLYGQR